MIHVLTLAVVLPLSARAEAPLTFEQSLDMLRTQTLAIRAEDHKRVVQNLEPQVRAAANDARRLESQADRLLWDLQDIVSRARTWTPPPPDNDPFFESDLMSLVMDFDRLEQDAEKLEAKVKNLARIAVKDPRLVNPAQELLNEAEDLKTSAERLERAARSATWDLSRVGRTSEASDLESSARDAKSAAQGTAAQAALLLQKVR